VTSDDVRTFFRIVRTDPPTLADFTSPTLRGKMPPTDDPEALRLAGGISVFRTEAQARRHARRMPMLGAYLAEVAIPSGAPVHSERTLRTPGHHTLWGTPAFLLACVSRVVAVAAMP
jgi:hypothetical protein